MDHPSNVHTWLQGDRYDVFISHCGRDCKRDFAIWLKTELQKVGVRSFFDEDSLAVGDKAADQILWAMETATYGVVILSPGFYKQEWCMKELQTFVRRGKVLPIFLPSFEAVEKARALAVDEEVWRKFEHFVLTGEEFADAVQHKLTGIRLEAFDGFWNTCIRQVRDSLLKLLDKGLGKVCLVEEDLLVGQHEHLVKLKALLGVPLDPCANAIEGRAQEVSIVGVNGMGGIGKTTLAKKLHDDPDVQAWFGGDVCWLKLGQKPDAGAICLLQKQILWELCELKEEIWNPEQGRAVLRRRLRDKRVLICLDDVWGDVSSELDVVRSQDLGPGSRILKTSRNKEVIGGVGYDLDILDNEAAWELFCWHAFQGRKPPEDLASLAIEATKSCGGLPLAISILGSQLAQEQDKQGCLESILNLRAQDPVMERCCRIVRSSYESLPDRPAGLQDAFVLIAGVWPNTPRFRDYERSIQNLGAAVYGGEGCVKRQQLAKNALKELANRSLIKIEVSKEDGSIDDRVEGSYQITVHDLLTDVAVALANDPPQVERRRFYRLVDRDAEAGLLEN
jgi:hypothetical protein